MLSDFDLNEAVARKLGLKNLRYEKSATGTDEFIGGDLGGSFTVPRYSTSIAAAWEVVEKFKQLNEEGFCFELGRNPFYWMAGWTDAVHSVWRAYAEADTAPRAICEAFLKLP